MYKNSPLVTSGHETVRYEIYRTFSDFGVSKARRATRAETW